MIFRIHRPLLTLFVLIIICGFSSWTYAQESVGQPRTGFFWINAGFGFSTNGPAAGISLTLQPPKPGYLLFSLRGITTSEEQGSEIGDVAVLIGYSSKRPQSRGYFSIATGISRVSGPPIESTFGIPVEVQLFYTLTSYAGIGLQGFADFNREQTFYGALLCLQFGTLQ